MTPDEKNDAVVFDKSQETRTPGDEWQPLRLVEYGSAEDLTEGMGPLGNDLTNFSA